MNTTTITAAVIAIPFLSGVLSFYQAGATDASGFCAPGGAYFDQEPPGTSPVIFAPEILVKPKQAHSNIVFSEAVTEAYWCYNGIWFSRLESGRWTEPELAPFSKEDFSDDAPFLSPDGKRLYFASKRSIDESDTTRKENLWVVDLEQDGWSEARPLPPVINKAFQHWQASVDRAGHIYFGRRIDGDTIRNKDIYCSRFVNGEYHEPVQLGETINSRHDEGNPYVSRDGRYLVFTRIRKERLEDGRRDVSLLVSFSRQDGTWSRPVDLREYLDFQHSANCATVTPDGKYLFFLDIYEGRYQRYWISAGLIDEARASHPEREHFDQ